MGAKGNVGVYAGGKWDPLAFGLDLYAVWGTSSTNITVAQQGVDRSCATPDPHS